MPKNVSLSEYILILVKTWMTSWVNASGTQKILLLPPILLLLEGYFICLAWLLTQLLPNVIAVHYLHTLNTVNFVALVITLAVLFLRHRSFMQYKFTVVCLYLLLLWYQLYLSYCVGVVSISVGYVAGAFMVVLLTMLNRLFGFITFILGSISLLIILSLTILGYIPYAPLVQPAMYGLGNLSPAYALSVILYLFPYIVFFVLVCIQVASQWVMREAQIRYLSTTDVMLGINNRRAITAELEAVLDRRNKQVDGEENISVILCDLDFFKRVNDTYGHAMGDKVLIAASQCLSNTLRDHDKLGRYGGEEFLITLAFADFAIAKLVAQRCRKAIESLIIYSDEGVRIPLTASFGVFSTHDATMQMDQIISRADACLYRAKSLGRNRVEAECDEIDYT